MLSYMLEQGSGLADLKRALGSVEKVPGVRGLLILGCVESAPPQEALAAVMKAQSLPVVGALFPRVLLNGRQYSRGFLVIGLTFVPEVRVLRDLSNPAIDLSEALAGWNLDGGTLLTLVDATAERIPVLIQALFNHFGLALQHIGGGAGSLSLERSRCILCNDGVLEDAAVLCHIPLAGTIGVAHGWQQVSQPAMVTAANGKTIMALEAVPASAVYADWLAAKLGAPVAEDSLEQHLPAFPLGLARLGSEPLVRDPIAVTPDGGLRLVSEIPEGAHVQLLHGQLGSLLNAAALVRDDVCSRHGQDFSFAMLIDCVSRALVLGDDFQQELSIFAGLSPVFGALTIGEVGGDGSGYLELLNKSVALGLFGREGPVG